MTDYKMLALYYLKHNKKRSLITILGVAIAVLVLYALLNFALDCFLDQRETRRKEADYDIVLFTESKEQIDAIVSREDVKSAYVGEGYDYEKETLCKQALYVNLMNPYKMSKTLKALEQEYQITGSLNLELALYYFNVGDDNAIFVTVMFVILIAYIFAIFGVGIIRNSIQLFSLEQIKDYGILRCIGATKGQLRVFIYIMGAILELLGILSGVLMGYLLSVGIGFAIVKRMVGFHVIPLIPILAAFLGDLYFVMQENCKFVNEMTPISAVRGEFRIKKEKIKVRKNHLITKLFGVEGDYAYKSLMRNPGRFWKSVASIGIGIGAVISVTTLITIINTRLVEDTKRFGRYQFCTYEPISVETDAKAIAADYLPSMDFLESVIENPEIDVAKRMYVASLSVADKEWVMRGLTEDYKKRSEWGIWLNELYTGDTRDDERKKWFREHPGNALEELTDVTVWGYDQEDYAHFEEYLIDGSLDVSDHGIVLVGRQQEPLNSDEVETLDDIVFEWFDVSNYKVGDTVDLVNPEKLRKMAAKKAKEEALERRKEAQEKEKENGEEVTEEPLSVYDYVTADDWYSCWQQLVDEGDYETYTIEGIVKQDALYESIRGGISFILPLDRYYTVTGLSDQDVSGMKFHMKGMEVSTKLYNALYDAFASGGGSAYLEILYFFSEIKKVAIYILLGVLFVVVLSGVNIVNTTACNLHLRKKEFAQLRVIGISKNRLIYTVMLEGILTTMAANIFGIGLGLSISYLLYYFMKMLFKLNFIVPWIAMLVGLLASGLLFCGSIYVPLKGLSLNMAEDLTTDGD